MTLFEPELKKFGNKVLHRRRYPFIGAQELTFYFIGFLNLFYCIKVCTSDRENFLTLWYPAQEISGIDHNSVLLNGIMIVGSLSFTFSQLEYILFWAELLLDWDINEEANSVLGRYAHPAISNETNHLNQWDGLMQQKARTWPVWHF